MLKRLLLSFATAIALAGGVTAQQGTVGPNINIVGGPARVNPATNVPEMGDPYLQRQNEPSGACSSRNPLNCLVGTNDYRSVQVPGLADGKVTGDASLGLFWTRDGGLTWRSWLLPGFPQDTSPEGLASPAHRYGAMADPTVRGGTNGLFYYTGIAFNRSAVGSNSAGVEGKDGVLFTAVYIDDNNTQQVDTPFRHVRQSAIAYSNGARFLDKPNMAVDIPRGGSGTCTIPGSADGSVPSQSFPGGNVYVVYSAFMGPTDHEHTKIIFVRSTDCGKTWGNQVKLSESFKINQSAAITISPVTGQVQVAWREFASQSNSDQIVVATSDDFGQSFKKGVVATSLNMSGVSSAFDQPSLPAAAAPGFRMFRTNTYPVICAAPSGEAYLLWAERGRGPNLESRIMYSRSRDGANWTPAAAVDNTPLPGYQFMPAVSCAGNKVTALWYDQRDDAALPITIPVFGLGTWIADVVELTIPARTLDVRSAQLSTDSLAPSFEPSIKVSRYPVGIFTVGTQLVPLQLQYNLENLPLFGGAKMPFIGDYIDVVPATTFLPLSANGGQSGVTPTGVTQKNNKRASRAVEAAAPNGWEFNTTPAGTPVFHAFWTDNRNVVPGAGDSPDPFATPSCSPGTQAGSKNQDVYTARLTRGLAAGVYGNARTQRIDPPTTPGFPPLTQRAYAVYVQNLTGVEKLVQLQVATVLTAPEKASFRQFDDAGAVRMLQAKIAPYSGIARTVYVSTNSAKSIRVDVDELVAAPAVGDATFIIINPDPTNPAPADTAVANFDETHGVTLGAPEVTNFRLADLNVNAANLGELEASNPTFLNPTFLNPTFLNPSFLNPTFLNPTFLNPSFLNPNFMNPNFLNPTFLNPTFLNPTFLNPTFMNPSFLNGAPDPTLTTLTWETQASANTASSYLFRALTTEPLDPAWAVQVLIYRLYFAPAPKGGTGPDRCELVDTVQHELITSVLNPTFLNPSFLNLDAKDPNFINSAESAEVANATYALNAGDRALITLQILTKDGALTVEEARQNITAVVIAQAVNSTAAAAGSTTPSVSLAITTSQLANAVVGTPYSQAVQAVGGVGNFAWSAKGLPAGVTISPSGVISGTPTTAGAFNVALTVVSGDQTATRTLPLLVVSPVSLFAEVIDPADNETQDISLARADVDGVNLKLTVSFGAGFDPATSAATFSLDTDQDNSTGHPGLDSAGTEDVEAVGVDYLVFIRRGTNGPTTRRAHVLKYTGTLNSFTQVGDFPVTINGSTFVVTFPLQTLDDDDGQLNFKVVSVKHLSDNTFTGTSTWDVAPDLGLPPASVALPFVADHQSVTNNEQRLVIGGAVQQRLAQVVTPLISGILTDVHLPVSCSEGSPLTIEIQGLTTQGSDQILVPDNDAFSTSTFTSDQVAAAAGVFKPFKLATPIPASGGNGFAIVLSSPGTCSLAQGTTFNADFYPRGGARFQTADNGPRWQQSERANLPFQIVLRPDSVVNGEFDEGLKGWTLLATDTSLQQGVVTAPAAFVPPLAGNTFNIRPGSQAPGAGLSQTVASLRGNTYTWSVTIAARDPQNPGGGFPLGTLQVVLNGSVVNTVTYDDANAHSETISGTFTTTTDAIELKIVLDRALHGFTSNPQWYIDKVVLRPQTF